MHTVCRDVVYGSKEDRPRAKWNVNKSCYLLNAVYEFLCSSCYWQTNKFSLCASFLTYFRNPLICNATEVFPFNELFLLPCHWCSFATEKWPWHPYHITFIVTFAKLIAAVCHSDDSVQYGHRDCRWLVGQSIWTQCHNMVFHEPVILLFLCHFVSYPVALCVSSAKLFRSHSFPVRQSNIFRQQTGNENIPKYWR